MNRRPIVHHQPEGPYAAPRPLWRRALVRAFDFALTVAVIWAMSFTAGSLGRHWGLW